MRTCGACMCVILRLYDVKPFGLVYGRTACVINLLDGTCGPDRTRSPRTTVDYCNSSASSLSSYRNLKMGASQSTGSHPQAPSRALHVLRVTPSSPASQTNIEAFFDFVVGLEGDTHSSRKTLDAAELEAIVEKNEGKTLSLLVWNSKSQTTRGQCHAPH